MVSKAMGSRTTVTPALMALTGLRASTPLASVLALAAISRPGPAPPAPTPRRCRYYVSSVANQGLGKSVDALQDARRAVQLDPNNTEYQMHLRRMQNPGQTYRTQTTYAQPGGLMRWCWSMILLNLLCNCCCGGGWGWRFRM